MGAWVRILLLAAIASSCSSSGGGAPADAGSPDGTTTACDDGPGFGFFFTPWEGYAPWLTLDEPTGGAVYGIDGTVASTAVEDAFEIAADGAAGSVQVTVRIHTATIAWPAIDGVVSIRSCAGAADGTSAVTITAGGDLWLRTGDASWTDACGTPGDLPFTVTPVDSGCATGGDDACAPHVGAFDVAATETVRVNSGGAALVSDSGYAVAASLLREHENACLDAGAPDGGSTRSGTWLAVKTAP